MSPRRLIVVVVALVAGAACSTAEVAVSSTDIEVGPPTTTSSTPPASLVESTTSTMPRQVVALDLHDVERLALLGGVTLDVHIDGSYAGSLSDGVPHMDLALAETTDVTFTYVGTNGESTDVTWSQRMHPDDGAVSVVQPWRDVDGVAVDFVLAWQRRLGSTAESVAELGEAPLTVVSPLWWNVNDEAVLSGSADPEYVAAMHERGIAVWPAVQGIHADGLHLMLSDPELRRSVVEQLASATEASGADGFNIDIEGFYDADAEDFSLFVEELAAAVHVWGGTVSYDLVPRSDTWDVTPPELAYWSTAPQRRRLAAAVDYTVLMAYDQHNRFRPDGPVAAPSWVEELITYQLRYSDPHATILGLPAYGRVWDPDELDAPRAIGFGAFNDLPGTRSADATFGMDRIDLEDGRHYWADNEVTPQRVALGRSFGLSGVAVWRLGFDDPAMWDAIS